MTGGLDFDDHILIWDRLDKVRAKHPDMVLLHGGSQGFNQIGEQIVGRSLNIQPTNIIRPGFPVRVMVHRDLVLTPYGQEVSR